MKNKKYISAYLIFTILVCGLLFYTDDKYEMSDKMQLNIYNAINVVKISEKKSRINDKNFEMSITMPDIHYADKNIERYINSCIRQDINNYINKQRQNAKINNEEQKHIKLDYHIPFENKNILNLFITKEIRVNNEYIFFEKDSYVFDLNSGQKIQLDNLFRNNENYKDEIENYINKYIDENSLDLDKNIIDIKNNTNYYISNNALGVYFNPYKVNNQQKYEFKIPYNVFDPKISSIVSESIGANIDVQTIVENNEEINSVINIPIVMFSDDEIEKNINNKITSDIMDFYNYAKKESKQAQGNPMFIVNIDFDVQKNSKHVLSIVVEHYIYSGGAHGETINKSYNINLKTGEQIKLSDIFIQDSNYKKVINDEIRNQISEKIKKDPEENVYSFDSISDEQDFYIRNDNIVVYFDLYEIAPYVAGIVEFSVDQDVIDHIIKDEYRYIFE